jgi:hypothetical protein
VTSSPRCSRNTSPQELQGRQIPKLLGVPGYWLTGQFSEKVGADGTDWLQFFGHPLDDDALLGPGADLITEHAEDPLTTFTHVISASVCCRVKPSVNGSR